MELTHVVVVVFTASMIAFLIWIEINSRRNTRKLKDDEAAVKRQAQPEQHS